jgi:hypothetical protein
MIALSKLTTVVQRNVCDLSNVFITGSSAAYKSISTRLGRTGVTWKPRLRAVLVGRRRESSQR